MYLGEEVIHTREETVTETHHITTGVTCDCCGESLSSDGTRGDAVAIRYTGGFASPVVGDMVTWAFEVCEPCLQRWTDTFKHPVRVHCDL
jgi:hypothetical protein